MSVRSGELSTCVGMSRVCEGVNDQALCVSRVRESGRMSGAFGVSIQQLWLLGSVGKLLGFCGICCL